MFEQHTVLNYFKTANKITPTPYFFKITYKNPRGTPYWIGGTPLFDSHTTDIINNGR